MMWGRGREKPKRKASTGPRSIERGNTGKKASTHWCAFMLQRGRAQSSAEMSQSLPAPQSQRVASTGPRSIERGNSDNQKQTRRLPRQASTGPRSIERGNNRTATKSRSTAHSFNGAALNRARKFRFAGNILNFVGSLQRGRAQSSAEIPHDTNCADARCSYFNGAALNRARK